MQPFSSYLGSAVIAALVATVALTTLMLLQHAAPLETPTVAYAARLSPSLAADIAAVNRAYRAFGIAGLAPIALVGLTLYFLLLNLPGLVLVRVAEWAYGGSAVFETLRPLWTAAMLTAVTSMLFLMAVRLGIGPVGASLVQPSTVVIATALAGLLFGSRKRAFEPLVRYWYL